MNARTFRWKERGATGEEPFSQFCQALTRAEQEAVQNLVAKINKAAEFDWRAAAFLLKRKTFRLDQSQGFKRHVS